MNRARAGRWGDLQVRVASGFVLLALGTLATWEGGLFFRLSLLVLFGIMTWELAGLTAPDTGSDTRQIRLGLAGLAVLTLGALMTVLPLPFGAVGLVLPVIGLYLTPRGDRVVIAIYGALMLAAAVGFLVLRQQGALVFLWLVLIVVVSDSAGYFAGRLLGGPKFWPSISPKKTWSGTVAGWIGAAVVGAVFAVAGHAGWGLLIMSPLVAFAGQMGDMLESWIKRRAGVKDASQLIPGHGGFLDRFDALISAVLCVLLISLVLPLPFAVVR